MEQIDTKIITPEECSYLDVAFSDLVVESIPVQETFGYCGGFTEENLEENE